MWNVTGLIWENKTVDGTIHDKNKTFTWYDSNPATNGGYAGTPGDDTDTEDFIRTLNSAHLGGYSDWRLPTMNELDSIQYQLFHQLWLPVMFNGCSVCKS